MNSYGPFEKVVHVLDPGASPGSGSSLCDVSGLPAAAFPLKKTNCAECRDALDALVALASELAFPSTISSNGTRRPSGLIPRWQQRLFREEEERHVGLRKPARTQCGRAHVRISAEREEDAVWLGEAYGRAGGGWRTSY